MADELVSRLLAVLDRQVQVDVAQALADAFDVRAAQPTPLTEIAFGLDSSVFLKLAAKSASATDQVDLLVSDRTGPLILPAQAVQEFWNNHQYNYVKSTADKMRDSFDVLMKDVEKLDSAFGGFRDKAKALLDEFTEGFGHLLDPEASRGVQALLRLLSKHADVVSVPRTDLAAIAANRKRTKTPPGFMDDGDGDFYIWAEFLHGAMRAQEAGRQFERLVLLTNDTKKDWSRREVPHPVLAAEAHALLGLPLELWKIETFARYVKEAGKAEAEADKGAPPAAAAGPVAAEPARQLGEVPADGDAAETAAGHGPEDGSGNPAVP